MALSLSIGVDRSLVKNRIEGKFHNSCPKSEKLFFSLQMIVPFNAVKKLCEERNYSALFRKTWQHTF